ncbi:MAG TPA: hypothetical protein VGG39_26160 [Polyangiaceae bacterium]|jgi:hypothetical protein
MPTIRILWAALTMSVLMMAGVTFVVVPQVPRDGLPMTNVIILVVAAVGVSIASFVMPPRAYAQSKAEVAEPEPGSGGVRGPARFVDPSRAVGRALAMGQTAFILAMALSEANACIGLAMHMLGAPHAWSLPFFALALVLMATRFPTPERILGPFERRHGATFAASEPGA